MFGKFKNQLEELGKKFNAELYNFKYNFDGNEIQSDWRVGRSLRHDRFEGEWTILDLISLGEKNPTNSIQEGIIHLYTLEEDEDSYPRYREFYEIQIFSNLKEMKEKNVRIKLFDNTWEKIFETIVEREEFKTIKSWQELIDRVKK